MYPAGFQVGGYHVSQTAIVQENESDSRGPENVEKLNKEYIDRHMPRLTGRCIKIP